MIRFPCHCDYIFELPEEKAGGLIQCPNCGRLNDIPTLGDLASITEDGTYKMDTTDEDPAEVNRLADLQHVFTKGKVDEWGREIDLRPTLDDVRASGAVEIPLELHDQVLPGAPKYDPETGELIRPMDVKPDPGLDAAGQPVPVAARAIHYAGSDAYMIGSSRIFLDLFSGPNVFVMLCVFVAHLFLQLLLIPMLLICLAIPIYLAVCALIIGHYANTIDETGPEGRDELPRPLRHMQWHEDIGGSFFRMMLAVFAGYGPAVLMLVVDGVPLAARGALALAFAGLGTVAFPAVVLTTTTSGSILNLRPDRVLGVARRLGASYIVAVLLWVVAGFTYGLGFLGTNATLITLFDGNTPKWAQIAFHPAITYSLLLTGIYFMHAFCWYMGLQYRWHHGALPWVLQRYTPAGGRYTSGLPTMPPPAPPAQGFAVIPQPKPVVPAQPADRGRSRGTRDVR